MPQTPPARQTPQMKTEPEQPQPLQLTVPNMYHLSGHHLQITYSTTSLTGQPILTYQDAHQAKSFRGDEIRAVECDLGTLVSVTIRMTIDMGSTTVSIFIPRMQIDQGTTAAVHTYSVTTLHSLSIAPPRRGQLDTYSITELRGTAQVVFP
jgi:hypothetical protein